jgi:hypothetical protein
MSAPTIADPAAAIRPARRRPRSRLRPTPGAPAARETQVAADRPLTVTISIDGGGAEGRDRIVAALRDLVEAVGDDRVVAVGASGDRGTGGSGDAGPSVVRLDPKPRAASRDGSVLDLSRLEYDLLLFFAENPRQVFSRAQLLERVWGHVHTGARTVDVHISRLRNKLDDHEVITTVYGVGYRLADGAPVRVV